MEYLLTIIIPNRNIFNLLRRCLDSLPRRSDIQILVVDDASQMTEKERMTYPGKEDSHVEVIFTTEARGAGYARNVALDKAKGKWLMFIDSDDFLLKDSLSLIDRYLDSEKDIIFFNIESCYSDTLQPARRHEKFHRSFTLYAQKEEQLEKFLRYGYTEPWGKLIRRDLVVRYGIRFDESPVANDYMFSVLTGYYAGSIELCRDPLVCVTERKGSLSYNFFSSDERTMARLKVYIRVQKFFDSKNIDLEPLFRFLRGIRGKKRYLYFDALSECSNMGYSRFEVIFRCLWGYLKVMSKSKFKFY